MTSPEDAPLDPAASDGAPAAQDAAEPTKGRDRAFWWKIRQDAPEPPAPHPTPIRTSRDPGARGTFLPNTGLRGWSTLSHRTGPGWTITETHAIGYKLGARGQVGALVESLVESIAVKARHAATRAVAVAVLERPLASPSLGSGAARAWKFSQGLAWVEGPDTSAPRDGRTTKIGARLFGAALKTEPPLVDGAWPVGTEPAPTDEQEQ